jgi:hypothetical protein
MGSEFGAITLPDEIRHPLFNLRCGCFCGNFSPSWRWTSSMRHVVYPPSCPLKQSPDASIPVPTILTGEMDDGRLQWFFITGYARVASLGRPGLLQQGDTLTTGTGKGSKVSPCRILRDELVQGQLRYGLFQPDVFTLQRFQILGLINL